MIVGNISDYINLASGNVEHATRRGYFTITSIVKFKASKTSTIKRSEAMQSKVKQREAK